MKDTYPKLEEEYLRLEPLQVIEDKERTELLDPVRLEWLPVVDDVRTAIIQNRGYFHIPDLKKTA